MGQNVSQSSPLNHGVYCSWSLEAEKSMLEENSQLLGVSTIAAMLCTKKITNDAVVPKHPRLRCYSLGIKSYFCSSAAKLMGHFLGMHN